ncbi:MAG: DUF4445 domain-containing protein [Planctomycetes bacterium]|nr:DUF4445 domain-containing protein [Planctomycetota bacterium]
MFVASAPCTLVDVLAALDLTLELPCGGTARCTGCRVRFAAGAPAPTPPERALLGDAAVAAGERLGCACVLHDTAILELPGPVWRAGGKGFGPDRLDVPATARGVGEALAVDLGTTAVAAARIDRATTRALAQVCAPNPLQRFGADVLARVSAASGGALRAELDAGLARVCAQVDPDRRADAVLVCANPVTTHLLVGADVASLVRAPFEPSFRSPQPFEVDGRRGLTLPLIGGHVGGDAVAAALACGLDRAVAPVALVDLGTNCEVLLALPGGRRLAASAAAGPAFAGGAERAATIAALLDAGVIDASGRLRDAPATAPVTARDVRALQLAKGAIAAALDVLLHRAGIAAADVAALHLCGVFGARLPVPFVARLGMCGDVPPERVTVWRDAAAIGVRALACERSPLERAVTFAARVEHVDLALDHDYRQRFVERLQFPSRPPAASPWTPNPPSRAR